MEVRFDDSELQRLYGEAGHSGGWPPGLVKQFRKVVGFICAATDERDFRGMRSLNFEKLQGNRAHQCSMRLNSQFRLIFEIEKGTPKNTIVIKSVEDYH